MPSNPNAVPILVVDDDEIIGRVLGRVLERDGYAVQRASSPARALDLLSEQAPPRLALLDLCYPDGDGEELARDLHARYADLPLILMTAYPLRLRDRPELARAFHSVLNKPINLEELRRVLRSALNGEAPAASTQTASYSANSHDRVEETMESSPRSHGETTATSSENGVAKPSTGTVAEHPAEPQKASISIAVAAIVLLAMAAIAAYMFHVPLPWQTGANTESPAVKGPPAGGALASVELVAGKPHTLVVPVDVQKSLGIRSGQNELIATAKLPTQSRAMVLPGSTALDPTRLYRIRARFAPARVVEIAHVPDLAVQGDHSELRELRSGDHVKKGDLLGVFYSADVGQKKNDLIDALYQLKLDEKILQLAQKAEASGSIPEVFMLNAQRNVEGDRNTIARALSNLRTWDIPEEDIQAVYKEAEEIGKRGGQRDRTKDDLWPRVELRAPADGVIVERNVVRDEMVIDQTVNLFQIATTERLFVTANVPEDDLPALLALTTSQRHWTVRTVGQLGKDGVEGRIDDISYLIDPNQHTAVVKGHIDNPVDQDNPDGRIRGGQFVTATVPIPPPTDVVEVPTDAVVDDGQQCVVFVLTDSAKNHYTMRRVELTQRFDKTVFVRSKPFTKEEQRSSEDAEMGILPKEPLRPGERVLRTSVGELKAALLDKESEPNKEQEKGK